MAASEDIAGLSIKYVEFPGRAGELQREGATASLVAELGDNYGVYHEFLASEFTRLGRPAVGKADAEGIAFYLTSWEKLQDVVRGEALLRACRNFRLGGVLAPAYEKEGPLLQNGGTQLGPVDSPKPPPAEQADTPPEDALPRKDDGTKDVSN